jgi:hypothetical protein
MARFTRYIWCISCRLPASYGINRLLLGAVDNLSRAVTCKSTGALDRHGTIPLHAQTPRQEEAKTAGRGLVEGVSMRIFFIVAIIYIACAGGCGYSKIVGPVGPPGNDPGVGRG